MYLSVIFQAKISLFLSPILLFVGQYSAYAICSPVEPVYEPYAYPVLYILVGAKVCAAVYCSATANICV